MVQIVKPRTLSLLSRAERRREGASFIVTALAMFDLADPAAGFESEQALWLAAAKALPPGGILDLGMPKPVAEVLVAGTARPPGGTPVIEMIVSHRIAGLEGRLAVIGDRVWQAGDRGFAPTPPRPFTEMPLHPARAFGGPEHPVNRFGRGHRAMARLRAGELVALPNIERPERLVLDIDDDPPPAVFGAGDLENPARRRFAGTYDRHWVEKVAPALPDDVDPRYFLLGGEEQWLDGYLEGNEPYLLNGFATDAPVISGRLPGLRVRAFVTMAAAREVLIELPMVIDTLWLVAGARRGILVWRGSKPVADIEAADVADVVLAYERMGEEPRPAADIADFVRLRSSPETAMRVALTDGPLVPPRGAVEEERRRAARRAHAEAEAARRHADKVWFTERRLAEAAVPRVLWPELPPPPEPLPLPTPEEITAGDIDLGELLDMVEAERRKAEAALAELARTGEEMKARLDVLGRPDSGPQDVDRLLAALAEMGGVESPAAAIDAQIAAIRPPSADLAIDPAEIRRVEAAQAEAADWRRAIVAAARPTVVSVDEEVAAAVTRMLRLPEGSPLAAARRGLAEARAIDFSGIAAEPVPPELAAAAAARASPATPALAALFAELEALPALGTEGRAQVSEGRRRLAALDEDLRTALPALRDAASPLETLLAEITAAAPPAEAAPDDLAGAVARAERVTRTTVDGAEADLDAAEARLLDGLAGMRRAALQPLYPEVMLSPAAARRFGDRVLEAVAAGRLPADADLAGADLAEADLTGAGLDGVLLERADLRRARLAGAALAGAAFTGASLDGADLTGCRMAGANLSRASLRGTVLRRAILDEATIVDADLTGADLAGARLGRVRLIRCRLDGADLSGAVLDAATVIECSLAGARLDGASVTGSQFVSVDLSGLSARGARLRGSSFLETRAAAADFSGARLYGCSFAGEVVFTDACFDAVEAPGTTWNGGDLAGARFRRARLEGAILIGCTLERASFRLARLVRARFDGCRLAGADFGAADLREAGLHRADLSGAFLRGANLFGADLTDAELAGADLADANLGRTLLALVATHAA